MRITTTFWLFIICHALPLCASAIQNRHANEEMLKLTSSTVTPSISYNNFNIQTDVDTTAASFPTGLLRIRRNISSLYIRNLQSRFNSQYQLRKLLQSIRPQRTAKKSFQQLRRAKFIKYHKAN